MICAVVWRRPGIWCKFMCVLFRLGREGTVPIWLSALVVFHLIMHLHSKT